MLPRRKTNRLDEPRASRRYSFGDPRKILHRCALEEADLVGSARLPPPRLALIDALNGKLIDRKCQIHLSESAPRLNALLAVSDHGPLLFRDFLPLVKADSLDVGLDGSNGVGRTADELG